MTSIIVMMRWSLLLIASLPLQSQSAQTLSDLHAKAQHQQITDRIGTLYDLAIAATAVNRPESAKWSLEMYDLATNALPNEGAGPQQNRAAQRKNALTVLSFTDPLTAARLFLDLEPSAAHQPLEDPRIDLSRHLFPKLWAMQGMQSLPTIRRLSDLTSEHGQYPYIAMGHVLPKIFETDPQTARSLFAAAVNRLETERGIIRTQRDYLLFLRETWPILTQPERRFALLAALSAIPHTVAGPRWHIEYYTAEGTIRFDSEEVSRVYDLLAMIHAVDPSWEQKVRQQYSSLATVPILPIDRLPWRASAVAMTPERDTPEKIEATLEQGQIFFLSKWSTEDPKRAAALALAMKDPARRSSALVQIIPEYSKIDRAQAERWRAGLLPASKNSAATDDQLSFLIAFTRLNLALGQPAEARSSATAAINLGEKMNDPGPLHELALIYGEFDYKTAMDLFHNTALQAAAARGSLRHAPNYEEPD